MEDSHLITHVCRVRRSIKHKISSLEHSSLFWSSPLEALFNQETIAVVLNYSTKTLECNRWRESGIPFRKVNGRVLYCKADVIKWLESHPLVNSTSEYKQEK